MSEIVLGIVDYGVGNHGSVANTLRHLGYRVRVSSDAEVLSHTDILVLPGVGAFPAAMNTLNASRLTNFLRQQANQNRPIVGICLGMQLLTSSSLENQLTEGLGLIPGKIVPLEGAKWHIGWNSIQCQKADKCFTDSDGENFYFNHSFRYEGPEEFQVCTAKHSVEFACVIRKHNIVGIQFHPEKSQIAGQKLLKNLIEDLVHA